MNLERDVLIVTIEGEIIETIWKFCLETRHQRPLPAAHLVRKDVDVNEHERLLNFTPPPLMSQSQQGLQLWVSLYTIFWLDNDPSARRRAVLFFCR